MRFLKKYFRLLLRILFLTIVGIVVYSLNLRYLFINTKHLAILQKEVIPISSEPIVRSAALAESPPLHNAKHSIRKDGKLTLEDLAFTEKDMVDENGTPFHIVIWNKHGGVPGYLANPKECMGNISCRITYIGPDADNAHAVVFPAGHTRNLPSVRRPEQLYAWWTLESPLHTAAPPSQVDGIFNLTFTYKTNAEVYAPYGSINLILRELKAANETNLEELLKKKRNSGKIAAWAVSNCYGKRMEYARSLMNAGLQVDTYGGCFGGKQLGSGRYSAAMYDTLSYYRFYFAFENSITCQDYFTEKFWFNGLRTGAVPVVWGPKKSDILKVAPTKSFIHANDFDSPESLVKYLNYLVSNETAYAEYLQWRTWTTHPEKIEERLQLKNRENDLRSFCKLCALVQYDAKLRKQGLRSPKRIVESIRETWIGSEKGQCHR